MGKAKYPEDRPCTKCGKSFPEVKFYYNGGKRRSRCASCENVYNKQWAKDNPEKCRTSRKKYQQAHPDKVRDKEKRRRKSTGYRDIKNWQKRNPDKMRVYKRVYRQKRRALLKNLHEHFTTQEWQELKAYYNHRCLRCGKSANDDGVVITPPDHVIPLSKGGTNGISNIQPLCLSCNSRKGTKDNDYRYYYSA